MISTQHIVEELVKDKPFLETALGSDLVNYSSLARQLRPKIEKKLLKSVKEGAIVMALKRVSSNLKKEISKSEDILKMLGDITIRSNLVDYTFLNSPTLTSAQNELIKKTENRKDIFLTISHGINQISIIASESLEPEIKGIFSKESPICTLENLSSLTIKIPLEATRIPGVLYSILKLLAWEGISLIEMISTFTELTLVLETKNIERAFSIIKEATGE